MPAVIVAHTWMGQDDFVREKAEALAELGYAGFAADLYGNGTVAATIEEATALMVPLFVDRKLLQERIGAAYEAIRRHPKVDADQIGAIGFCFGGLTVIELLRSGKALNGVVSFHGVLGNQLRDVKANTVPIASSVKGSLLILHGHDDPLVSRRDIKDLEEECEKADIDWQFHAYGHTMHAFTNPEAQDSANGMVFNPKSSARAWQAMRNFFQELFV
jgi:dienelactone hydrolase